MVTTNPSKIAVPYPRLDPERTRTAGRTAIASVISLCIVLIYRFPEGYWALITCIVMTQASVGASIDKGVLRVIGTVTACIIGVVWLAPLNQNPFPFLLVTFAIISVSAYLGSGSVYPYAFVIGGVTVVMVAVLGFESQNAAVSKGLARSGEIVVGVLVSWFCAFAFWPRRASEQLDESIRGTLSGTARAFDEAVDGIFAGTPPAAGYLANLEDIGQRIRGQLALIPAAAREGGKHRTRAPADRRLAVQLERLRATLLPLAEPMGELPNPFFEATAPELRHLVERIQEAWRRTVADAGRADCEAALAAIQPARHDVERRVEELRRAGATSHATARQVVGFHGFLGTLREIESSLHTVSRRGEEESESPTPSLRERFWGFSLDQPRRRYAIKTGLAVCFAVTILNVLQWESSVSAMISTFIVAQLTIGGSVRKGMLRMSGAFLGGALALFVILVITPNTSSLPPFALVIFVVMFFCAYAYTGPETSAYAGLQTGLAFVIVLVAGAKQETSLMPGIYRLVGVMLGTAISIGVETVLWPSHAYIDLRDRIRQTLVGSGTLFRELSVGLRGAPPPADDWWRRARATRSRITAFWQILGEALLEGKEAREAIAFDLPVAGATEEMMHRIARLAVRFDRPVNPMLRDLVGDALDDILDGLERTLDRLPNYLDGNAPDEDIYAAGDALRESSLRLLDALEKARTDRRTLDLPESEVSFFVGLLDAVVRIAQGVSVVCGTLARGPRT